MNTPLRRRTRQWVLDHGWRSGTDLEDCATRFLDSVGFTPEETLQQHQIGRWRVDYAWPDLKVVLEIDGWHHRSPEGATRDAERDADLRSQGWLIFRVDDRHGEESMLDQLARVSRTIHMMRANEGLPNLTRRRRR